MNSCVLCWNMMYRRIFNFNKWESVSLFIAGIGRLNFSHVYQLLQFNMLKKFMHDSTNVVARLMKCHLLDTWLNELCREYTICLSMPFGAIKRSINVHFWSATGLFEWLLLLWYSSHQYYVSCVVSLVYISHCVLLVSFRASFSCILHLIANKLGYLRANEWLFKVNG